MCPSPRLSFDFLGVQKVGMVAQNSREVKLKLGQMTAGLLFLADFHVVTFEYLMQGSVQDAGQRPNQPVAPLSFLRVAEPLMKGTGYQILKTAALQTTS